MSGRIPIPEAYGLALFVVYGLSCFSLSAQLHRRWFAARPSLFPRLHVLVLGLTASWGAVLFGTRALFGGGLVLAAVSLPLGAGLGALALWADRRLLRHVSRRGTAPARRRGALESRSEYEQVDPYVPRARRALAGRARQEPVPGRARGEALLLVVIATLEEVLYRGFLPRACFLLPGTAPALVALLGVTLAFALSHIGFGWPHVLAKLPLSVLAMASVLVLDSVLAAVVAHGLFNFVTWYEQTRQPELLRERGQVAGNPGFPAF